jgi:hypothetical protein
LSIEEFKVFICRRKQIKIVARKIWKTFEIGRVGFEWMSVGYVAGIVQLLQVIS